MEVPDFNADSARWIPARPELPELDAWLNGDRQRCHVVKGNTKRTVYAISPEPDTPPTVYLKHDHPQSPRDQSKSLIRPKVKYEYLHTKALRDAGIPIIDPIAGAWMTIDGISLSRALPDSIAGDELWDELKDDPERRARYLAGLRELVRVLLEKDVFHPDFHLGNVLCVEERDRTNFFLVDAFGVKQKSRLGQKDVIRLLLVLSLIRTELSENEVRCFLVGLPKLPNLPPKEIWRRVLQQNVREFYDKWPKRKRKLLRGRGYVRRTSSALGPVLYEDSFDPTRATDVIRIHQKTRDESPDDLLKNSRKRCVSRCTIDGTSYLVKEFRAPGPWGRFASDARCWLNNWGLLSSGFTVPQVHAWVRGNDAAGYLVFQFLDDAVPVHKVMAAAKSQTMFDEVANSVYSLVRELYTWRIVHEDLKMNNLMVQGNTLWLIDNDAVLFNVNIKSKHWERNRRHLLHWSDDDTVQRFAEWLSRQEAPTTGLP